eukprot:Gregarina_sp_Pseudo_9__5664@NODE_7_length_7070_cov_43_502062_g5_i0_p4_GENE_NODE_7_length_7070_cov_43_502062_g5_i0NODE_7_length_7070_cov_43_502062_g5_i0_p4_ORF_typecomplete_len442_score71_22UPF0184/PF03670_13/0_02UPF0184/PF03670_13/2e03Syntaxin/PF00804_25/0_057_NODE_7_length_7070_cov_43_502062_g5_i037855110
MGFMRREPSMMQQHFSPVFPSQGLSRFSATAQSPPLPIYPTVQPRWNPLFTSYSPLYVTAANPALRSPSTYVSTDSLRAHSSPNVRTVPPYRPVPTQILQASPPVRRPSAYAGTRVVSAVGSLQAVRSSPLANALIRTSESPPVARTVDIGLRAQCPPVLISKRSPPVSQRKTQPASSRRDSGGNALDLRTLEDTCSSVMTAVFSETDTGTAQPGFSFGGRIEAGIRTERSHDVSTSGPSVATQRGRIRCRPHVLRQKAAPDQELGVSPVRGIRRFQCSSRSRKLPILKEINSTTADTNSCAHRIEEKIDELQAQLAEQAAKTSVAAAADRVVESRLSTPVSGCAGSLLLGTKPQQFSLISVGGISSGFKERSCSSDTLYDNVGNDQLHALQELAALNAAASELQRCVLRVQKAIALAGDATPDTDDTSIPPTEETTQLNS